MPVAQALELSQVRPNPDQPRKLFEQRAMDELVASIREMGILQPITVRPDPDRPGSYVIIGGERRWRAACTAGLTEIPAMVRGADDDASSFLASVSENVTRADMTILEEAAAFARLLDLGYTAEDVAEKLGKRTADIRWRIELLRLIPACQEAVQKGVMKPSLAWYVSKLSPAGQQTVLRKHARGEFRKEVDAIRFAQAVEQAEGEETLFGEVPSPEVQQARERTRREALSTVEKARRLLAEVGRIATMDPLALSDALGGQFGPLEQLERELAHVAAAYRKTVGSARAMAAARQEIVAKAAL